MFGDDFYPTPKDLTDSMIALCDMTTVTTVLEPSAGRGDIIDRIVERRRYERSVTIDAIEVDQDLRLILEGKSYKPVAADFLTFTSYRRYDLVIMNPPFSEGDKHLLKAIDLQKDGGQIVCLLNAETIRNPHTNRRKDLCKLIESYSGTVTYVRDAFKDADRATAVEIAIVYLNIPEASQSSDILKNIVEAQAYEDSENTASSDLVEGDYIRGAVKRYEVEAQAGLKLINEYRALSPILSKSFTDKDRPIIELTVDSNRYGNHVNAFIEALRMKYWQQLFQSSDFRRIFTSKTRDDYTKKINDLARYEFNIVNIKQMQIDITNSMLESLDDSIVRLFEEFSNQYWDEQSNNIHYYDGWKTNKAYVVNKKVITRLDAFSYSWKGFDPTWSNVVEKLGDIEKVFGYLEGKIVKDNDPMTQALDAAKQSGQTRNIELPYCTVTFFKKGTCHIVFKNLELLKKFNLIGSKRKGWLPPEYGKKNYDDMTAEARDVVDSYEGKASYEEMQQNQQFYLERASLALGMGVVA